MTAINYNVVTFLIEFVWDDQKNLRNKRKHKLSFEEARSAFFDDNGLLIEDPDHSGEEGGGDHHEKRI